ncbi:nuclease EXOG, mitochondrial-like [Mobula hypostoma]|uniref:nuclease EXOG, mitochondrial-like n=1 Tax=Mobula hypostoma TaxID=723540 RepID=UPI002FC3C936
MARRGAFRLVLRALNWSGGGGGGNANAGVSAPSPSRRLFGAGFVCGSVLGSFGCALIVHWTRRPQDEEKAEGELLEDNLLEKFGLPLLGSDVRYCTNHISSYDQAKRTPRWVLEHITKEKVQGTADRKHCKFKPDPTVSPCFSATNEDYFNSGWSRGHMVPAGDNKYSLKAMAETFYLSNIVPQNYENNAGFWNRLEIYCRDLTQRYKDIWVISGPLTLPTTGADGKKTVTYEVIGSNEVAVPTHLYKVILAQKDSASSAPLSLGAFVVPNEPIGFDHQLAEYQVNLQTLEKMAGLTFFPVLDKTSQCCDLCEADTCRMLDAREFTLYVAARKVRSARTLHRLETVMGELRENGIQPDKYLADLYQQKKQEVELKEPSENQAAKGG